MKKRWLRLFSALAAAALMFALSLSAAALSDTYRFEAFGMSVKVAKSYYVITRDTPADDPVFTALQLSYRDTMADFESADIYLRAYDPDGIFQLSLTVIRSERSESIGSYADLSDSDRREILDTLSASVDSASEVKHGSYIFFDSARSVTVDDKLLYINQCNTVVNGLQIDLSLRKEEEPIAAAEAKALIALAASVEFDTVQTPVSGPKFDWWRLLLWAFILVVLTVTISFAARHRGNVRQRRVEERRRKRGEADAADAPSPVPVVDRPVTFDESLGYREGDRFSSRAGTDLDTFDISVREKHPDSGVSFFEDGGKSIDDRSGDYFDAYFKEATPSRSGIARLFATAGAYLGILLRHIGYFFRNLFRIFRRRKKGS